MNNAQMLFCHIDSPVGPLLLAGQEGRLNLVSFADGRGARRPLAGWRRDDAGFAEAARQFGEYFAGKRQQFDLAIEAQGNDFQAAVWHQMCQIPYGQTRTYGEVARAIGETAVASRAVGTACGENPLPIVVPCHRVVGANGAMTGFGGGLWRKRHLLDLEFRTAPPADTLFGFGADRAPA
jgi:methylated-DNA-[protein]-cysteine S-methyltransferase